MKNETTTTPKDTTGSLLGHLLTSLLTMVGLVIICCGLYPLAVWGIAELVFPYQANGSLINKDNQRTNSDDQAVGSALLGQAFTLPGYFHPRPSAANNSAGASFSSSGGYDPTASGGTNYGPLNDTLLNGATTQPAAPATQSAVATTAATTAPAEVLSYDGVRLRTLHYALDNGLTFKLLRNGVEVPLKQFQNTDGSLNDTAVVDAFPHPANDPDGRAVLTATDFRSPNGTSVEIPADAVTASASGLDPHISPANAQLQATRIATARKVELEKVKALIDTFTDQPTFGLLGDPGVNVLRLNIELDAKYPLPK